MACRTLIALLLAPMALSAQTVGLLSMVSGDVKIQRPGESTPVAARTADLIAAGDRVLTGVNSEAMFLFCPESRAARMTAASEVQFDAAALAVRKGKLDQERKVPTCKLPATLALSAASKLQSGQMRLRGDGLVLRAPALSSVPSAQPKFRWDAVESATGYEVKLLDREENILWRQNVSAPEIAYAGGPELKWGQKYWWRVRALDGSETLAEASSNFQLLPADQAEVVRTSEESLLQLRQASPADNGPLFLLAFLYEENNMLDQAARIYGELAQRMGPQDWVQARLNELMGKLRWDRLESGAPR
jgi:hypothetical protein